jgi:hypothetical protein
MPECIAMFSFIIFSAASKILFSQNVHTKFYVVDKFFMASQLSQFLS